MKLQDADLPSLPCMCAEFRRAARALTHLYDDALRPCGLRATQFTILQALALTGEITQGRLGEILAMDSTTLTRTLQLLRLHGWIEEHPGRDRRERFVRLSKAGHRQFRQAETYWRRAQAKVRSALGPTMDKAMQTANSVAGAMTTVSET